MADDIITFPKNSAQTKRYESLDLDGLGRLDIDSAIRNTRPLLDFVLPGMLAGTIALLVGPGGVSKSMLALQTAAAIATGFDHWSMWSADRQPLRQGRVAVFNSEDPAIILQSRIHDIGASRAIQPNGKEMFNELFHQNVDIWPLTGRGFSFAERNHKNGKVIPTDWIEWLDDKVAGVRLAIVDTWIRALGEIDENSSKEVAPVLSMLETICRRRGVAFLILHHTNKSSSMSDTPTAAESARGSSALTSNARSQTNLATMSPEKAKGYSIEDDERKRWVQVDLSKVNYGPPVESRWLHRGEGGVLYGERQPGASQKVPDRDNKHSGAKSRVYTDPRRHKPPFYADEIDMRTKGDL
jgi:RecA-family ATPase